MSHLACAEAPEHPLNERQIRLFREMRIALSRHPLLARQFVRHLPRRRRPLRPGAPGRRALRRQSDARAEQSDAAGGRTAGAHRAGAQRAARRDRRLRRRLDRQARDPHRGGRGRLCRRLSARGQRLRRARRAPTRIVAGKRCPLVGRVSMDLLAIDVTDLPDSAARRGDLVTLIGDELDVDDGRERRPAPSATRCSPASGRRYHRVYRG